MKRVYSTFLIIMILALGGCTRDDVCSENTPTTPLLVIDFKDFSNPEVEKSVSGLSIVLLDANNTVVIPTASTAQVSIPLDTRTDAIRLFFTMDTGVDNENIDLVTLTYQREDIYVNRACSFKTIYNDLSGSLDTTTDDDTWIRRINILNSTIENEDEAHITILH